MKIHVIPFAEAINSELVAGKTTVVIDILRATSVMITALQNGAREIIPCQTIQQAKEKAKALSKGSYLLCGERDARKIAGFDLGNSPLEFTPQIVENKTLIITTTNGTKALNACREAKRIYVGAFLNMAAIQEKVKDQDKLVLVCSGTRGRFSMDDGMCAAAIINGLKNHHQLSLDDLGKTLLMNYMNRSGKLINLLSKCNHLNYLISNGYGEDVNFCLQTNIYPIIPRFSRDNNMIIV